METYSFNISDPDDYRRLRNLIAPSLVEVEQSRPPPARARSKECHKNNNAVPRVLLPAQFGAPATWTQAERGLNAEIRTLLEEAKSCPFESKAQRTAAMIDIMLKHPDVSFHGPDRERTSVQSSQGARYLGSGKIRRRKNKHLQSQTDESYVSETPSDDERTMLETLYQVNGNIDRKPSTTTYEERTYTQGLRRRLQLNNMALVQGRKPKRFAGKTPKIKERSSYQDRQNSLLDSIELQFRLSDIETESHGTSVAANIRTFWIDGQSDECSVLLSDEYGRKLRHKADEIQKMLHNHDQTSSGAKTSARSSLPSMPLLQTSSQDRISVTPATQTQTTAAFGVASAPGLMGESHLTSGENVKSEVTIRLTLEGGEETQLMLFSEEHYQSQFLGKVAELFPDKHVLLVTMSPNSTFGLPKAQTIGKDESGRQAWEAVRSDLIELSKRTRRSYNEVAVSALVHYQD